MNKHNFGKIGNLLLLGGGPIMAQLIKIQNFFPIKVITAERFLNEVIDDKNVTFKEFLVSEQVEFLVSSDVNYDEKVNEFISEDTLGLSISAPWIIKQVFIDKFFNGALINLHTSLLPEYRGGGGPSWKILNGEEKGAFSIHFITTGIDDGDILFSEEYEYDNDCIYPNSWNLTDNRKCIIGLNNVLEMIFDERDFDRTSQNHELSVYFPRLNSISQGYIDWRWDAFEIVSFIKAFSFPFEGAKTQIEGKLIKIRSAKLGRKKYYHPFMHGLIVRKFENEITVAASNNEIVLTNLTDNNDYDCLKKLRLGDRMFTPSLLLERAFIHRAIYDASGLINKNIEGEKF
jgi:methionyl-tRNA formyltransferase